MPLCLTDIWQACETTFVLLLIVYSPNRALTGDEATSHVALMIFGQQRLAVAPCGVLSRLVSQIFATASGACNGSSISGAFAFHGFIPLLHDLRRAAGRSAFHLTTRLHDL